MSENPLTLFTGEKRGVLYTYNKVQQQGGWGEGTHRTQTYFCQFLILVDASQASILNSSAEFIQGNSLCSQRHKGEGPETADRRPAEQGNLLGSLWFKVGESTDFFQGETKAV